MTGNMVDTHPVGQPDARTREEITMDTREVAEQLGTDSKTLRRFIRSDGCTFQPVGSGGRYEFTDDDVSTLRDQFKRWADGQAVAKSRTTTPRPSRTRSARMMTPYDRDQAVWAEEGRVFIPDINDPKVRADVRRRTAQANAQIEELLIAAGLHITNGFAGHKPPTS